MKAALPARLDAPVDALRIRRLAPGDLSAVARIDAHHTGERKTAYWRSLLRAFLEARGRKTRVGLVAEMEGRVVGYLLGEVRAFEFGSPPCGWIFAVGVDPARLRRGIASALLAEACRTFGAEGINTVRTMVRRNEVPVLSFFRSSGFAGGAYVQLELNLGPRV